MREYVRYVGLIGLAIGIFAAGCNAVDTPREGPTSSGRFIRTEVQDTYVDGKVQVVGVEEPDAATGRITFHVRNQSQEELLDLPFIITLYYLEENSETNVERLVPSSTDVTVTLYPGQTKSLTAVAERAGSVRGYGLYLHALASVGDPVHGTEYIAGRVRLIELDPELAANPPQLKFVLKNISGQYVEALDYRLVFRSRSGQVAATDYMSVPADAMPPGGTVTVTPDLSRIGADLTGAQVVIQLRELGL